MATEVPSAADNAEDSDAAVQIKEMRKTFDEGNVVACEDISLSINKDEFVVILGPSGCGKTTTLRCIAGLEIPDEGSIQIHDRDIAQTKPKDRDLAFVFQSIALFPHMTVRENMRFGLDMNSDLSISDKDERVDDVSSLLNIEELLERKPEALSGGQQQRVSLGRAMVMEPAAFLLDEPFSALDAQLRDEMRTEVKQLQQTLQTAMIFVTHDQEEAMVLADKIVIMNDGQIQQVATPKDIYDEPENRFVAEFIGAPSANFIDCHYDASQEQLVVENSFLSFPAPKDALAEADVNDGDSVVFSIRPENISLTSDPNKSNAFTATTVLHEPHGDRDAIRLEADDLSINAVINQDDYHPEIGENTGVNLDFERFWLFDNNGERIY